MIPLTSACRQLAKSFALIFQVRPDNCYQKQCYWSLRKHYITRCARHLVIWKEIKFFDKISIHYYGLRVTLFYLHPSRVNYSRIIIVFFVLVAIQSRLPCERRVNIWEKCSCAQEEYVRSTAIASFSADKAN